MRDPTLKVHRMITISFSDALVSAFILGSFGARRRATIGGGQSGKATLPSEAHVKEKETLCDMSYQTIFKRYELKFCLTRRQQEELMKVMEPYMKLDHYGHTLIRNLYFDTDSYQLIRRSQEKPIYKEKLRVRSYRRAEPSSTVFVELKKKYRSVVYKRRVALTESEALSWLCGSRFPSSDSQIAEEIEYFRTFYSTLHPACFLSYERDAFHSLGKDDLRVTFDDAIIARVAELSLETEIWGTALLEPDHVLMEIKTSGGIPLWMSDFLTRNHIYKTSFSKYGEAYCKEIAGKQCKERSYA